MTLSRSESPSEFNADAERIANLERELAALHRRHTPRLQRSTSQFIYGNSPLRQPEDGINSLSCTDLKESPFRDQSSPQEHLHPLLRTPLSSRMNILNQYLQPDPDRILETPPEQLLEDDKIHNESQKKVSLQERFFPDDPVGRRRYLDFRVIPFIVIKSF